MLSSLNTCEPLASPFCEPITGLQGWKSLGNIPLTCACVLPPTWTGPGNLAPRMIRSKLPTPATK